MIQKTSNILVRFHRPFTFLILLIGIALRLISLRLQELWYDEAYSGIIVRQDWQTMFAMVREDVHPPMYYLFLKVWSLFTGTSPDTLRLFSVVCGVALMLSVVLWARELFSTNKIKQLLLVLFIAVNPFFISYSVEARAYALAGLLFAATTYFIHKALTADRKFGYNRYWFVASIFVAITSLTHYALEFGVLALMLWVMFQPSVRQGLRSNFKKTASLLVLIALPLILIQLVWLSNLIYQFGKGGVGWIPRAEFSFLSRSLYAFTYGVQRHILGVPPVNEISLFIKPESIGVILIAVFMVMLTVFLLKAKQRYLALFLVWVTFLPILLLIIASWLGIHMYVERYLTGYGVTWLILFGYLIMQQRWRYIILISAIYIVSLLFVVQSRGNTNYSGIACLVRSSNVPQVVITNPLAKVVLRYYLDEDYDAKLKVFDPANKNNYASWSIITPKRVISNVPDLQTGSLFITEKGNKLPDGMRGDKLGEYDEFAVYKVL